VKAVLAAFAAERLLTLAADGVEISYEALLTAWPLLCDGGLAETHADRVIRTQRGRLGPPTPVSPSSVAGTRRSSCGGRANVKIGASRG
jgi:hypothetical protein